MQDLDRGSFRQILWYLPIQDACSISQTCRILNVRSREFLQAIWQVRKYRSHRFKANARYSVIHYADMAQESDIFTIDLSSAGCESMILAKAETYCRSRQRRRFCFVSVFGMILERIGSLAKANDPPKFRHGLEDVFQSIHVKLLQKSLSSGFIQTKHKMPDIGTGCICYFSCADCCDDSVCGRELSHVTVDPLPRVFDDDRHLPECGYRVNKLFTCSDTAHFSDESAPESRLRSTDVFFPSELQTRIEDWISYVLFKLRPLPPIMKLDILDRMSLDLDIVPRK